MNRAKEMFLMIVSVLILQPPVVIDGNGANMNGGKDLSLLRIDLLKHRSNGRRAGLPLVRWGRGKGTGSG